MSKWSVVNCKRNKPLNNLNIIQICKIVDLKKKNNNNEELV